jgi:hypothetical protein
MAQELLNRVRRAPDAADKSKRVVNDDITRRGLKCCSALMTDRFLESIEREAVMEKKRAGAIAAAPRRRSAGPRTFGTTASGTPRSAYSEISFMALRIRGG